MSLPRVFVSSPLRIGQQISLDAAASIHLLQVLRLKIKDRVIIFNNTGGEFYTTLVAIDKRRATIVLDKFVEKNNESPIKIHLGQGVSRGEKMDFTIQKAVELGVYAITPIFTEYCNVKLAGERLEKRMRHWQAVAISAAEQSGRCYVPKILPAQTLAEWSKDVDVDLRLVLDPDGEMSFGDLNQDPTSIAILVGPEGGFSGDELVLVKENQFLSVVLGPRILRTETAALAAISALQAKWGDFC